MGTYGDGRSYVTGYFALDLDGVKCGLIQEFSGGDVEGDVTVLPMAHDYYVKKHIGNVKYNDFSLKMGLSMATPVQDWVKASFDMNYMRKSGELKSADFRRQVRKRTVFSDALITEIGFPALDGGSKDAAFLNLKFSPWIVRTELGDKSTVDNPVDVKQKTFHPSNYRFTIDGLEGACKKVQKIDAITVKQSVIRDNIGEERDYLGEPGKLEFPNLKITLSEEYAPDFYTWFKDFVIDGNNDDTKHKTGSLVFLNSARNAELLTLNFQGLGVFKVTAAARKNNEDAIASVTVEMYCENILVKFT